METLKFLMVSTHFPPYQMGGDAIFVGYLSEELARRGHEVHVAYNPSVYRILRGELPKGHEKNPTSSVVRHECSPVAPRLSLATSLMFGIDSRARRWLKSLESRFSFDVVHWHNTKGFISRPFAVGGAVSLYTAHDYNAICPRSNLIRPGDRVCELPELCQTCLLRWRKPPQLWRVGSWRVLRFPEGFKILCPSEYIAKRLRDDGAPVHRVLRGFVPDPGRALSEVTDREDTILFVGILERRKGPQTLLQAFIDSGREQGFKLALVGEGPLRKNLIERVRSNGIQDRVSVPGFIAGSDLRTMLSCSSLMVIPSEWPENAPSTALEAFSFGVPVAGTKMGGLPEILTPESGSMLFEAGSVRELSGLLVSLWEDRHALRLRGRTARRTYEERFSPEIHLAEYMRVIGEPGQESTDLALTHR